MIGNDWLATEDRIGERMAFPDRNGGQGDTVRHIADSVYGGHVRLRVCVNDHSTIRLQHDACALQT